MEKEYNSIGMTNLSLEETNALAFEFTYQNNKAGMVGGYCEPDFPFYYANKEIVTILGYENMEEFVQSIEGKVINTIHPEDREQVIKDLGESFYEGMTYEITYRMLRKDQTWFWTIDKGKVVRTKDGRLAILSVCTDMSKFVKRQKELETKNMASDYMFKNLPGGYHRCAIDEGYSFLYVSQRFLDFLGWTEEEIQTKFDNKFINLVHPDDRDIAPEYVNRILNDTLENPHQDVIYRLQCKNGYRWFSDTTMKVNVENQTFFQGFITDISSVITEREEREKELQKLLKASEQRYEIISALGTAYEEICQVDLIAKTYTVVAGGFEGKTGSLEDLRTLFIDKNISKEYREEANAFIDFSTIGMRLSEQKFISHEFKSKSGNWFLISFIVKKKNENGEVTRILLTARDVNEQKERELEQQRLTRMRLETMAEAIHGGFRLCKFDKPCTFIMVSEQLANMLGYDSPEELMISSGGSMEGIVNYEDSASEMKQAFHSIEVGKMYTMHYRVRCKNGRWKNIEDRGRLIRNEFGENEIWSFMVDQDELVKKTQALENAKNINKALEKKQIWTDDYYKNLLDMVNCGVICYSMPEHQILHMNAEALRIYGTDDMKQAQAIMKELLYNVVYLDPTVPKRLKELRIKDGSIDYECIITNLLGESFNIMAQTEVVTSLKKERSVVTTFLDISENQTLKNEKSLLEKLAREAKLANEAKTNFLRRMSHDIRTPLNGIMGLLEIDEAHFDDVELVRENHKKMKTAANYLLSLINDVLQTSKLEDGKVVLTHDVIDLSEMSRDIINIISVRAMEAGVKWSYEKGDVVIPHPYIYGSPVHLRQIFLNIYGNCIKYNRPNGEIKTTVECLENNEKVCCYRWIISDTGIGMSQEFLEHIFEPFVQENTEVKSSYQGVGLGMSIVKGLLDQMGGTIKITSKEGVGSTFEITIPFDIAPAPSNLPKHTVEVEEDIHGIHLMLVEDNALNAEIAQALLIDQGAKITVATDGQKAVEMFCSNPPDTFDVILMDMMMPVMDGLTATKAIRALERIDAKTIPIIAMTANAFKEDEEKCLEAGMNAHLAKPLDVTMVKKTICEQIRRK